jgi:hypothetical protein
MVSVLAAAAMKEEKFAKTYPNSQSILKCSDSIPISLGKRVCPSQDHSIK